MCIYSIYLYLKFVLKCKYLNKNWSYLAIYTKIIAATFLSNNFRWFHYKDLISRQTIEYFKTLKNV